MVDEGCCDPGQCWDDDSQQCVDSGTCIYLGGASAKFCSNGDWVGLLAVTQCTVDEDCSSWGLVEYTCGATPSLCVDGCNNPIGCLWCGQPTNENYRASACFNGLDDDGDGAIDCADPDCSCVRFGDEICVGGTSYVCSSSNLCQSLSCGGSTYRCVYNSSIGRYYWSTSLPSGFCCSDNDCSGYDPNTHTKLVCNCPNVDYCSLQDSTKPYYTCQALPSCSQPADCEDNWCCDIYVDRGTCKQEGSIITYNGKSYLCDPPEGFVSTSLASSSQSLQVQENKNIFDLIINFFSNLFS